jgi:tRNA(fMet)-specific endonuclease VapC
VLTQILLRRDVPPWDEAAARCYGELCGKLEARGVNLSDFDMMIAARAVALNAILVSRDKALARLTDRLQLEAW